MIKSLLLVGLGSFCGGALRYYIQSNSWCLILTAGFCGGFTTFSAFANESLQMLQSGNTLNLTIYILASVLAGIALVALGYWLVK